MAAEEVAVVGTDRDICRETLEHWFNSDAAECTQARRPAYFIASVNEAGRDLGHTLVDINARQIGAFLRTVAEKAEDLDDRRRVSVEDGRQASFKIAPPGEQSRKLPSDYKKVVVDKRMLERLKKARDEGRVAIAGAAAAAASIAQLTDTVATLRALVFSMAAELDTLKQGGIVPPLPPPPAPPPPAPPPSEERCLALKAAFYEVKSISPDMSFRNMPIIAALFTVGVLNQMGLGHFASLASIVSAIPCPSSVASWMIQIGNLSETTFLNELGEIDGAYMLNDHGNKKGREMLVELFAFWSKKEKKLKVVFADNGVTDKSSAAVKARMMKTMRRMGIKTLLGTCTDSAANAISGLVNELLPHFPGMNTTGCLLHIINLILMNAYFAGFGDEERGENSALRLAFMVPYLVNMYWEEFVSWASVHRVGEKMHHCAKGEEGRWWSIIVGFGDVLRSRELYSDFFRYQTDCNKSTSAYTPLLKETAAWLRNPKAELDMTFVHAFCMSFYAPAMSFLQSVDEYQLEHPLDKDKHAGFRAARMTRMIIMWYRHLEEFVEEGLDHEDMAGVKSMWQTLPEGNVRAGFLIQVDVYFNMASNVLRKHGMRWLTDLVDTSLGDHSGVAGPVAAALLSIYDEAPLPIIPVDKKIVVDGAELELKHLISDMVQFVTPQGLREKSVLFSSASTVAHIRVLVKGNWDFNPTGGTRTAASVRESGEFMLGEIRRLIVPIPTDNILSEHAVQIAGKSRAAYAPQLRQEISGVLHFNKTNSIDVEAKDAFQAYRESGRMNLNLCREQSRSFRRRGKEVRVWKSGGEWGEGERARGKQRWHT